MWIRKTVLRNDFMELGTKEISFQERIQLKSESQRDLGIYKMEDGFISSSQPLFLHFITSTRPSPFNANIVQLQFFATRWEKNVFLLMNAFKIDFSMQTTFPQESNSSYSCLSFFHVKNYFYAKEKLSKTVNTD